MKVSELTGAQLDYWVAMAEGNLLVGPVDWDDVGYEFYDRKRLNYSANWGLAGPIIERKTDAILMQAGHADMWPTGKDLLPFLMRAYVASRFGEEVPQFVDCTATQEAPPGSPKGYFVRNTD